MVSQFFDALLFVTSESSRLTLPMVTRIVEYLDERGDTVHVAHSFSSGVETRLPDWYCRQILFERNELVVGPVRYTIEIRRPPAFLYHNSFDLSGRFEFDEYETRSLDMALARREQWIYTLRREAEGR